MSGSRPFPLSFSLEPPPPPPPPPSSPALRAVPSVPGRAEPGCTAPAVGPHHGDQTGGDSLQRPGRSLQVLGRPALLRPPVVPCSFFLSFGDPGRLRVSSPGSHPCPGFPVPPLLPFPVDPYLGRHHPSFSAAASLFLTPPSIPPRAALEFPHFLSSPATLVSPQAKPLRQSLDLWHFGAAPPPSHCFFWLSGFHRPFYPLLPPSHFPNSVERLQGF